MWRQPVILVAMASGCGFSPSSATVDGAPGDGIRRDAGDGGEQGAIDAPPCSMGGLINVCLIAPDPALTLGTEQINTNNDPRCITGETEGCVIAARSIIVSGAVTAIGSKPLILVAETTIVVTGSIDVSSTRGGAEGAGANPTICSTAGAGTDGAGGASGGAGGGFGGSGGNGGLGDDNDARHPGGVAGAVQVATFVRGGCPGGKGGDGAVGTGGAGGSGGGAVYLAAGVTISVGSGGAIYASGAGGGGGTLGYGAGGGGGSGGIVGLDAPSVNVAGTIAANGAGGGGGCSRADVSSNGGPGADGTRATYAIAAAGGPNGGLSSQSGTGGDGTGGVTVVAQTPGPVNGSGGGGGGGLGVVWVRGALTGTMISPAIEQH